MKTVLVANRGEIARRVIRACRQAGLGVVAVCSEADREAAHAVEADDLRVIGPAPARDSYLRSEAVLDAARAMGADAIHPGYGFLSENAAFAAEVLRRGLTWIGPDPKTIAAMGDKQRAREIASQAGVPVVPGSSRFGPDAPADEIAAAAAAVGWPLLVKASAGGGGIGMREVAGPEQLDRVVTAARSMADRAFGDATLYFERRILKARHVEVQVFGFGDGRAVALGERDCSLQRRFQKVVEESPAPDLPERARAVMSEAALKLCRAVRYAGAGTVEFILDAETGEPFFLEMNTRIQVEHPVTEMVAGVDLVRMQLDFAGGLMIDPPVLPVPRGHAIECRIYAEDADRSFFPAPGRLTLYREPPARPGLRIDAGYREGDDITPFYDPMIAKLIAHGPDRDAARRVAIDALREFKIEGPRTNLRFLVACLEDPDFAAARVDTGFIEQHRARLLAAASAAGASA